jgi:CIC family chloride channel protein
MRRWPKRIETLLTRVRQYVRTHLEEVLRIRERVWLNEETFHLLLAGGVGVIGALVNRFFYTAIGLIQMALIGYSGRNISEAAAEMDSWARILAPTAGGLAAGYALFFGLHLVGKQGSTNLLEVVVAGDGKLPFRSAIIRSLSSLLSIGTGASIGREGGITQLTATLASKWGQLAKWQPYRLRLLVACGAASGIAAAYNAPIAGAVFAAQIVLGNFSMNLFAPLLFSSVIASVMSRHFFGVKPWYEVPTFDFTSVTQLPWFILLGVLAGLLGAGFLKLLRRSEELFEKIPALYLRLAAAGLLVGAIAVFRPEVWGNGYFVTNDILKDQTFPLAQQKFTLAVLAGIFLAKLIATVATVGSGAVGGVFTPTLFLGAGLGSLLGVALQRMGWAPVEMPLGAFAMVGMGSVLAATTRSPLLAIIMVFEISLNYSLMPALMIGCAVSTLVARRFHPNSIYTEPLKLRSLEVESYRLGAATEQTIGDMMRAPVAPVRENTTLPELAERFLTGTNNFLPVVDKNQRLLGVVALQDLKEYLNAGQELSAVIAYDVMRPPPRCLTPRQKLMDALPVILSSELQNVPVVTTFEENRLVGSIPRAEALGIVSEAIAASSATTSSPEQVPTKTPTPPEPPPATK